MGTRRTLVLATLAAVAATALVAVPGASAGANHEVTRTAGAVGATLSWRGDFAETKNFRIQISRDNVVLVSEPVRVEDCGEPIRGYACPWPVGDSPLEIRDLDADGEPEVIVRAFTGGAHCCVVALIYRWTGGEYVSSERNFFGAAWTLKDFDQDGIVEFRTSDYRFDFLYGSHAESVFPIQIMRFDAGSFTDVTREFPKQVGRDARLLGREYERRAETRKRLGVRSALAAYVADLYLLGGKRDANRVLKDALEKGVLERNRFGPGPWGRKFVRHLKRTLDRFGYIE
ncbi:MAG TPA: hypothetical protein VHF58_09800 [Solirubrobacterales bacterium]|nr:hypothetical protein [Solirubrobacterales bacterium]